MKGCVLMSAEEFEKVMEEENKQNSDRVWVEKRKGPDPIVKWVNKAGYITWGILFVILCCIGLARGREATFIDKMANIPVDVAWNNNMLWVSLIITFVLFVLCMVSIVLNIMRSRRKTDTISMSLILCEFFSFLGGMFLLFKIYG